MKFISNLKKISCVALDFFPSLNMFNYLENVKNQVHIELSLNCIISLNVMMLCSKFQNGILVTKSKVQEVVTKFNVTKSRLQYA